MVRNLLGVLLLTISSFAFGGSWNAKQEDSAWHQALDLAKATSAERSQFQQPMVLYVGTPVLNVVKSHDGCGGEPGSGTVCARRLCGETNFFYTLKPFDKESLMPGTLTLDYLLPGEESYRPGVLVHEFLHTIWWNRVLHIKGFQTENPDTEAWVQSLLSIECPQL